MLAVPSIASAAPRTHDGFYFEGTLGPAYVTTSPHSDAETIDFKISGFGLSTSALFGGTVAPGFVLGGGYLYNSAISPTIERGSQSIESDDDVRVNLTTLGAFADYFPLPQGGFHVQALVGYGVLSSSNSDNQSNAGSGLSVSAGLGYEFWIAPEWSFGFLGRVNYAAINDKEVDDLTWVTWAPALLFTATYH